jgi:hypothetical protein
MLGNIIIIIIITKQVHLPYALAQTCSLPTQLCDSIHCYCLLLMHVRPLQHRLRD